ncbi:hypothetical protein ACQP25_30235 [Microtetraspora malaysiensis]|uniref:hypothetical protein n=1 Tax=Microtetraspora malaysiensis TaxID=161358 RepID=UPI003D945EB7
MYNLQKLLWDVRKYPELSKRFRADPNPVLDEYGIEGEERAELASLDFKALYDRGANPYLLYFYALEIGVDRAEYYARLRGELS